MSPRVPSSAMTTPRDARCRHFSMNASWSKSSIVDTIFAWACARRSSMSATRWSSTGCRPTSCIRSSGV